LEHPSGAEYVTLIGGGLLIANHQSDTVRTSQIIFITLFYAGSQLEHPSGAEYVRLQNFPVGASKWR